MCCWWRRFDNQDARTDNLDSLDTAGVGTVDFGADWLQQLQNIQYSSEITENINHILNQIVDTNT